MENLKQNEGNGMEITHDIIIKEINEMKERYDKLGELFKNKEKDIHELVPIEGTIEILKEKIKNKGNEKKDIMKKLKLEEKIENLNLKETNKNLEKIKEHPKYPYIVSKYPELVKYYGKTIYIFFVDEFPYKKEYIEDEFKKLKEPKDRKRKFSLCRINETKNWDDVESKKNICLYVGSSEDILQRLREHLFLLECYPDTYAMHLATWFKKDISIHIKIWGFNDFLSGKEDLDYLQYIEDLLWNHYEPLFGRQGKK